MGTFFAYARVSTPRQGEKGVSLQEQRDAIERYARQHELQISRWFEERESASRTGRPAFSDMLRLLRLGKVSGVIIHKIDRGVRNLEDWADVGKLSDSGVEVHFATENVDLRSVAGRLSADIQAVVAAHYSRNLREEVKKGLYGRLKQGWYPFRAPIGYLDHGSAKAKTVDPVRGPLIKQAFELYASGSFSLPTLAREMFSRGLRNLNGGTVSVNGTATILKNPFYISLIRIYKTRQTFEGVHEPLVTSETFRKVQDILAGKRFDRSNIHLFTYSRIVRCGSCRYSLIAECQKGYVYYRCHKRPFKNPVECPPTAVREEQLDQAVAHRLREVELSEAEIALARSFLEAQRTELQHNLATAKQALQLQLENVQKRLEKLADLLIDGTVDKDVFTSKRDAALVDQAGIKEKLADIEKGYSKALGSLEKIVELAKSPLILYEQASLPNKREFLKALLSNFIVTGKNIEITLAIPFRLIAEREKTEGGRPSRGTCRTWITILNKITKHFETEAGRIQTA